MRRLFSMFAHGAPGAGLLIMRIAAGTALVVQAVETLVTGPAVVSSVLHALSVIVGVLLLVGLWSPIAGALTAVYAVSEAFSSPAHAGFYILVGAVGAALALLGPGGWSIDARLFGWKRIEVRSGNNQHRALS